LAIDLIAQTGLSSLPVIYYLEQLFRIIRNSGRRWDWKTESVSGKRRM